MKLFDEKYKMLNEKQKLAVDTINGPVFVMAGPGTGKTQILTLRIANIIQKVEEIEPENILSLTFTNAGSYNMTERLGEFIGAHDANRVYISTFHSFAEDMIKKYPQYFERYISSRLVSPVQQIELIHKITDSLGGEIFAKNKRRTQTLNSISFSIGKIKGEGLTVDEFRKKVNGKFDEDMNSPDIHYKRAYKSFKAGDIKLAEVFKIKTLKEKNLALCDIFEAYEIELKKNNLYDYNDLISSLVHELQSGSHFASELQEQFRYILVDEHQDTNDAQNDILHALISNPNSKESPNIFVVGDPKQSIYRFAGASQRGFTRIFDKVNDVKTIELESNYRSDQNILDHAQNLISNSEDHAQEPDLKAFFKHKSELSYREFNNYKTEALWVVSEIKNRIDNGEDPNEIAILFRGNSDATEFRILLDVYGITYRDQSKNNILKDPDMNKFFLLLRCVHDLLDDVSVSRSLFIDFLDFDLLGVQKVLKAYKNQRNNNSSLFEMISDEKKLKSIELKEGELEKYRGFVKMILEQKSKSKNDDFIGFFTDFIRQSGFLKDMLKKPDAILAMTKVEKLFDEIKTERGSRENFEFDDAINYLNTLLENNITINVSSTITKGVNLMTFHGSKGLEFETVYIVRALKKKSTPQEISLPFDSFSNSDVEDERRLLYVAITRAKKNCLLSSFVHNHEGKEQSKSIHISEIDMLQSVDMSVWEQENLEKFADFFSQSSTKLVSIADPEYIKERFLASRISFSSLSNYLNSPLVYFFRNIVSLPEESNLNFAFGNLIHNTLEDYFNNNITAEINEDQLRESYEKILKSNNDYNEFREKGWKTLENYFRHYSTFDVAIENELNVKVLPFESDRGDIINLTGKIDKITKNVDGEIVVWDYKTGKSFSDLTKDRKDKLKLQATFYKLLLQNSFDGKLNPSKIIFDFVEPCKKSGEYEQYELFITQQDIEVLKTEINNLINDILDGTLLSGVQANNQQNKEYLELLEIIKGDDDLQQGRLFK